MVKENVKAKLIAKILQLEYKASRDFYYFTKHIIGFKDLTKKTHRPLCQFLQHDPAKRKLILMPRGTFKTSIISISFPIFWLTIDPNARILISSDTYDNATKCLLKIKNILETNEKIKTMFGDFVGSRWREDEIYISQRTQAHKEPSISCGSQDVTRVGQHYDIIILDDIVTDVNVNTKEQLQKTIDYYKSLYSILEPTGTMIVVGTRWVFNDLYGYILEHQKDDFSCFIRKAIMEDNEIFFPERFPREKLEELKRLQGSAMFSAQYLNTPISPEDTIFKKVFTYEEKELPEKLNITVTIDPAISLSEKADYTAIVVCGTDERECIYVLDYINARLTITDLIDTIFFIDKKWKPSVIGLETNSFQILIKSFLESEELKQKKFLPITELKSTQKSKYMRILSLQPYIERGQILVKKGMDELIEQIMNYPKCEHDDLIDALAYQLQIYSPYHSALEKSQEIEPTEEDNWRKLGKAPATIKREEEDYDNIDWY